MESSDSINTGLHLSHLMMDISYKTQPIHKQNITAITKAYFKLFKSFICFVMSYFAKNEESCYELWWSVLVIISALRVNVLQLIVKHHLRYLK